MLLLGSVLCSYVRQLLLERVSLILPLNLILAYFSSGVYFTLIGHYFGSICSLLISKNKKYLKPNFKQINYYFIFSHLYFVH